MADINEEEIVWLDTDGVNTKGPTQAEIDASGIKFTDIDPINKDDRHGGVEDLPHTTGDINASIEDNQSNADFLEGDFVGQVSNQLDVAKKSSGGNISTERQNLSAAISALNNSSSRLSINKKLSDASESFGISTDEVKSMLKDKDQPNQQILDLRKDIDEIKSSSKHLSLLSSVIKAEDKLELVDDDFALELNTRRAIAEGLNPTPEGVAYAKALYEVRKEGLEINKKREALADKLGMTPEELDEAIANGEIETESPAIAAFRNFLITTETNAVNKERGRASQAYEKSENFAPTDGFSQSKKLSNSTRMTQAEIDEYKKSLNKGAEASNQPADGFSSFLNSVKRGLNALGRGTASVFNRFGGQSVTDKFNNTFKFKDDYSKFADNYEVKSQAVINASSDYQEVFKDFQSELARVSSLRGEQPWETVQAMNNLDIADGDIKGLASDYNKIMNSDSGREASAELTARTIELELLNDQLDVSMHNDKFKYDDFNTITSSMDRVQEAGQNQVVKDNDGKMAELNKKLSESMKEMGEKISELMTKLAGALRGSVSR